MEVCKNGSKKKKKRILQHLGKAQHVTARVCLLMMYLRFMCVCLGGGAGVAHRNGQLQVVESHPMSVLETVPGSSATANVKC